MIQRREKLFDSNSRREPRVSRTLGRLIRVGPIYKLANLLTAARFVVQGDSMLPNFSGEQYILVSRMSYKWSSPARGDVVVLRDPRQRSRTYIKRIVGLPGECLHVEDGHVFASGRLLDEPYLKSRNIGHAASARDGEDAGGIPAQDTSWHREPVPQGPPDTWSLGDGQYFVMGDNRLDSGDSRSFGPVRRELIVGRAWIRYWPRSDWGIIP